MRVGGIGVHSDDRPVRGGDALVGKPVPDELGDIEFIDPLHQVFSGESECLVYDQSQLVRGFAMVGQLLGRPLVSCVLHQVGGRDHLRAKASDQLDRAGVHA